MGKKQHSKDQLYLTRTEYDSGVNRSAGKQSTLHLPCARSPVATEPSPPLPLPPL